MARRGTSFAVPAERPSSRPRDLGPSAASDSQITILARGLVGARTREDAIEAAVRFCAAGMEMPAAVWVADPTEGVLLLVGTWGIDDATRDAVEGVLGYLPDGVADEYEAIAAVFEDLCAVDEVEAVRAGAVLLIHAVASPAYDHVLSSVADLLHETLRRFDRADGADELPLGLALTAHELRAPVLGARAAVERLRGRAGMFSEDVRLLSAAERELTDLSDRVDQLLRWAVGTTRPLRLPSDLAAVVRGAAEGCRPEGWEDRIVVDAPARLIVPIDATHIRSAVENLIGNALAYSPSRYPVRVTVRRAGDRALVRVRDHGPGIPPDEGDSVFDPFLRGCAGRVRRGHGLGLFIAKRIVDEHGGEIRYRRVAGGGTCFTISLPMR